MSEPVSAIERKKQLLEQVYEITCEQSRLLNGEHTDELLTCLSDRQKMIDEINALKVPETVTVYQEKILAEEINQLLQKIVTQDKENEAAAQKTLDIFQSQLRKVRQGQIQSNAYNAVPADESLYIDKRK